MKEIQVRMSDLLAILKGNRDKHRQAFEAALVAYRDALENHLEAEIQRLRNNKGAIVVNVRLPVPEDHTTDYDRVIRMVALGIEAGQDTIELDDFAAAQYVMDDWGWKQAFATTANFYSVNT